MPFNKKCKSLLCPDITYCLYHLGNADWIMCKVDIDTVSNKILCRHKLIYNISLTRDQSGLKNRSVIPSEHGCTVVELFTTGFYLPGHSSLPQTQLIARMVLLRILFCQIT